MLKDAVLMAPKNKLYLEFGVYTGGSINNIAEWIYPEKTYGFDSFQGLPEDYMSAMPKGYFKLTKLPQVSTNVILIVGKYQDVLPFPFGKEIGFVHIDCDLYTSATTVLEGIRPYLAHGAILMFDEWINNHAKATEEEAFNDFARKYNVKYKIENWSGDKCCLRYLGSALDYKNR